MIIEETELGIYLGNKYGGILISDWNECQLEHDHSSTRITNDDGRIVLSWREMTELTTWIRDEMREARLQSRKLLEEVSKSLQARATA